MTAEQETGRDPMMNYLMGAVDGFSESLSSTMGGLKGGLMGVLSLTGVISFNSSNENESQAETAVTPNIVTVQPVMLDTKAELERINQVGSSFSPELLAQANEATAGLSDPKAMMSSVENAGPAQLSYLATLNNSGIIQQTGIGLS